MSRLRCALSTVLLTAVVPFVLTGCGRVDATSGVDHATAPSKTRPASKQTCPDVAWHPAASFRVAETERNLVGFSPTVLGVDTEYSAANGITAETVSGGYVDDLTEPYDDLIVTGHLRLPGNSRLGDVMHGSLQGVPVDLVTWRESNLDKPCDVHALLIEGADPATARALMRALR